MTRPSDSSIARAFWEAYEGVGDGYIDELYVVARAAEFDAESPAGPELAPNDGFEKSDGWKLDGPGHGVTTLTINGKVCAPPERVQIPAESKRVCSWTSCRAEMRPGLRCSSPHCGLKE